jgi:hypothetical protein
VSTPLSTRSSFVGAVGFVGGLLFVMGLRLRLVNAGVGTARSGDAARAMLQQQQPRAVSCELAVNCRLT